MDIRFRQILRYFTVVMVGGLYASMAWGIVSFKDIDPEGVSFKAGPTKSFENLALAWVETALYPKNVIRGREIFIEVNLTSKVDEVEASFDFDPKGLKLFSENGTSWNRVYKVPVELEQGVHVVKLEIKNKRGREIQRTLDFVVVDENQKTAQNHFTVKVLALSPLIDKDQIVAKLEPGTRVEALYKAPFYRVKLENGTEGWVAASNVEEQTGELYLQGYRYYITNDYANAAVSYKRVVDVDPLNFKAHYWLAKSYLKLGKIDLAILHINEVVQKNPDNIEASLLATQLTERFLQQARELEKSQNYAQALNAYQNIVALNPDRQTAWVDLGNLYKKTGVENKARDAWMQALRINPDNDQAHALLNTRVFQMAKAPSAGPKALTASTPAPKTNIIAAAAPKSDFRRLAYIDEMADRQKAAVESSSSLARLPQDLERNSIAIVKEAKTHKGTPVSNAVASVLSMTRSLGTKIYEEGWHVRTSPQGTAVIFACRQERNGKVENENFEFRVNVDNNEVAPLNANAKLLMSRW